MGKWVTIVRPGSTFHQWQPTTKGEKLPDCDPWDGCPICGANPLPKGGDPESLSERLQLTHDSTEHDKWTQQFVRNFQDDVTEVVGRMEPPTEPSRT